MKEVGLQGMANDDRRDLPPLTSLRVFEVAAKHQSFAMAAIELGSTRSAICYHIKLLEKHLRTQLFRRHGRRVTLSSEGQQLYAPLTEAFDVLHMTCTAISGPHRPVAARTKSGGNGPKGIAPIGSKTPIA